MDIAVIRYSLLFPVLMSVGFGSIFVYGARLINIMREDIHAIGNALHFISIPEVKVLKVLLIVSAILFFLVAVCLVVLFFFGSVIK
jgi:hypothetical protein